MVSTQQNIIEIIKDSLYFNDKGKIVKGPLFNLANIFPGDTVMVYEEGQHIKAKVHSVSQYELIYTHGKSQGTYSPRSANVIVKESKLPKIYKIA